jgi:hypothetical protein
MPIVETDKLVQGPNPKARQIYNGLDCAITLEVFNTISGHRNRHPLIYSFVRAIQAPALEMMLRGWKVNEYARRKAVTGLKKDLDRLYFLLEGYARAVWDEPPKLRKKDGRLLYLNPLSPKQLQKFFYQTMRLPEVWTSKKGKRSLSMDREALEKLSDYWQALPIINCILAIREASKTITTLETEVDPDGRMRTSYNIVGTETGRWSSSSNAWGAGGNLQNVDPDLRYIFESDLGWKICGIDLEQAESREVGWIIGNLFGDWTYLNACEAGDLHTTTARLIWPDLGWPGDPKGDRAIADRIFYRHFSYRDMSKRGGHGTTYYGTPPTMARHLKVPTKLMVDFQQKFFSAYPGIPKWHTWVATELQTTQFLVTPFGRERHFFGRPNDDATLREAIAYVPQSATADRTNLGLWRIWKHMGRRVQVLHQNHDAVYFLYREDDNEAEVIQQALSLMEVKVVNPAGRPFVVPGEAKVGWNWGNMHNPSKPIGPGNERNPNGLVKWKGKDERKRQVGLDMVL